MSKGTNPRETKHLLAHRNPGKEAKFVRIPPVFGQKCRKGRLVCPNSTSIRTEMPERKPGLSESHQYSDRNAGKEARFVRIPPVFGQKCRKGSQVCPNPTSIRTEIPERKPGLSESHRYSDRNPGKEARFVRNPPVFGQKCRKGRLVCPKSTGIRTEMPERKASLSESHQYSDRNAGKEARFVRIPPVFGQKCRKGSQVCPNPTP
ncbi:hypothetical protein D3H55_10950 [Bacillus salacetis]|uniref:Uncharacterized protein n=1 Tax=Bacillus salacetis TaxID=2315464 RepID=A0A3A1R3N7_9BACI|nr:hypothetical protein [Bacillus salacetis]RIW33595.1 hypothetical protein D3H55_10950 [Bacillus salacetis]